MLIAAILSELIKLRPVILDNELFTKMMQCGRAPALIVAIANPVPQFTRYQQAASGPRLLDVEGLFLA